MRVRTAFSWAGLILLGAGLSACATAGPSLPPADHLVSPEQTDAPRPISDPNEDFNRSVFENNQKFNHAVLYPAAKAYNDGVPQVVRDRVDAFTTNLSEPMVFANDVLQFRLQAAATTLGRFAVNSTLGLGGLFDVAAAEGLSHQSGDFGQTLYVWGFRNSNYLVLPIVGPTNVRDAIGSGIELIAQLPVAALMPAQIASTANVVNVAGTVASPLADLSKAEDMQVLEESSMDFYTMLKSVTHQKRQAELQEALNTSALTGPPVPPDPNAIEPVMVLVSSPTMLEKPQTVIAQNKPVADGPTVSSFMQRGGTVVVVGPPTQAPVSQEEAE